MRNDERNYKKQLDAYEQHLEEKKQQVGLSPQEEKLLEEVKMRKKQFKGLLIRRWVIRFIGIITVCSLVFSEVRMPFEETEIAFTPVKNPIVLEQKGEVEAPYTLQFTSKSARLSRDGSLAYEVQPGEVVEKPGLYYLSQVNEEGELAIEVFEIPQTSKEVWEINTEDDLIEAFKYALENVQDTLRVNLSQEFINEDVPHQAIYKAIHTYPNLITPQRYETSYVEETTKGKRVIEFRFIYGITEQAVKVDYKQKLDGMLQYILSQTIEPQMTDLEREYSILDYIVKTTAYSQDQQSNGDYPRLTHTIYGAIVDNIAVCDGYSKQLNYLLNAVGVPSQMIVGESRKQGHQWNLVQLGGEYYHVDVTWADGGSLLEMRYINQSDKSMQITHSWERGNYPACEATGSLLKPPFETKNLLDLRLLLPKLVAIIPAALLFWFVFRHLKAQAAIKASKRMDKSGEEEDLSHEEEVPPSHEDDEQE